MKNFTLILFFSLLTGLLSGCSGISKKDCHDSNWTQQGYRDGLSGKRPIAIAFERYIHSCSKYSLAPNKAEYEKGFSSGYEAKCQYANSRAPYDKTCLEINTNYNHEYTIGKISKLEQELRDIKYENRRLLRENYSLQDTIDRLRLEKH